MECVFSRFLRLEIEMGDQLSPAMLAQIEALWAMKEVKQKEEMKEYIDMSRKASIEIKKREFLARLGKIIYFSDLAFNCSLRWRTSSRTPE